MYVYTVPLFFFSRVLSLAIRLDCWPVYNMIRRACLLYPVGTMAWHCIRYASCWVYNLESLCRSVVTTELLALSTAVEK